MAITADDVKRWHRMYQQLKQLKDEESALRRDIFNELFRGLGKGTHRAQVGDCEVKTVITHERKVDAAVLLATADDLSQAEKAAIKWEPKINARAYNALKPEERTVLSQAVTVKNGSISLEVLYTEVQQ